MTSYTFKGAGCCPYLHHLLLAAFVAFVGGAAVGGKD